jgi:hypothetical protein
MPLLKIFTVAVHPAIYHFIILQWLSQNQILFFATILFLTLSPVQPQDLPISTTSKEARSHFEPGRLDAFH